MKILQFYRRLLKIILGKLNNLVMIDYNQLVLVKEIHADKSEVIDYHSMNCLIK